MAPEWQDVGLYTSAVESPGSAGTAAARRVVIVVLATTALWALVSGLFQPFLPLYIASLGGSATDVDLPVRQPGSPISLPNRYRAIRRRRRARANLPSKGVEEKWPRWEYLS